MYYKNRTTPRGLIFLIDLSIVAFSILLSYLLRFNFNIPDSELKLMPYGLAIIILVRAILFLSVKSFAGIIRYTETQDIIRIFLISLVGSLIIGAIDIGIKFFYEFYIIPRAIIIIEFIATAFALASFRMIVKVTYNEIKNPSSAKENIAIYGAGEAAVLTKRAVEQDTVSKNKIVAFIDDNIKKSGKKIDNIDIYHSKNFINILKEKNVKEVIISIQKISADKKKKIAEVCINNDIKVLDVPPVNTWINGQLSRKQIKQVNILDLLGREEIEINESKIKQEISGKNILVTGAAGSIGSEILRQLIKYNPGKIIALDQAESPLFYLELEFSKNNVANKNIDFKIIDIRNKSRINKLFREFKPQLVFHAAAYKHVPIMESNPYEAINTNLIGTKIIADCSIEYNVEKFVMISTDKAVNPTNVMGASKRLAEIYVQNISKDNNSTSFITTRFGNVLGSNGSVITLFDKQIKNGGPLTITHPDVTRYFMTIPEACKLVLEAAVNGENNELFVFDMGESVKIIDLAKKMIKLSGLEIGKDIQIDITGLRPGEKLYEEVLSNEENTLPTHHPKILKAKKKEVNTSKLQYLIENYTEIEDEENVRIIKEIIPEYKSENSMYTSLDK